MLVSKWFSTFGFGRFADQSRQTAILKLPVKVLATLLTVLVHPTCAAPLDITHGPKPDQGLNLDRNSVTTNGGIPNNIVPNFQDLSAVLSLLAADAVEEKFCTPSTSTWERMSAVWSIFGIIGLGRACIKIAAGLKGAEAAGFRLNGAGAFTSKRTKEAFNAWPVGSSSSDIWCDDNGQLLKSAYVPSGTWRKPFIVVHGYSQCPPWRGVRQFYLEIWGLCLVAIVTVGLELGPLLLLWRYTPNDIGSPSLALGALGGLVAGCVLPIVLTSLNDMDVPRLADLAPMGRQSKVRSQLSQAGDLILATPYQRIVKWKTGSWRRSGDVFLVRILAAVSLLSILATYILNYVLLGMAPAHVTYVWLAFQVAIMAGRYYLWARKPNFLPVRHCALVYTVMGNLFDPLPANPWRNAILPVDKGPTLSDSLIELAVAAACSQSTNRDVSTTMYDLNALLRLAGTAPRDILLAKRCHLQHIPEKIRKTYRVVRLPWPFIEELYLAQGLILGPNPRSYEGLDITVVFDGQEFMGLTSVHPESHPHFGKGVVGRTVDGIAVSGNLCDGSLEPQGWTKLDDSMEPEHHRFWQNVDNCRNMAVANGPASVEIHAVYEGANGARATWDHVHQRVHEVDAALELVRRICVTAVRKEHDSCRAHCTLYRLEPSMVN